ncbi:MAG: hypothetical protein P8K76_13990 [Candidatus Binatia bacterium]|nr:hypothetical protein [Candidatus Binatia bacterium]MDG1401506.1 hypothetical protein [Candidatus Binatia bacterium]MDG1957735.1 hypothetical protein [Candidatus Binatia bacterium]MDG2010880.1 hypothetical protein [Candidatus Binatia bacterium]HAC79282.1 hypothetical protein [Deltaproteobacteria bacterium]
MDDAEIKKEADDLLRIWGEIGRRVGHSGFRSVEDLISQHGQVRVATEQVAKEEIDAGLLRVHGLLGRLRAMRREMTDLLDLKEKLPQLGDI